MSQSTPQSPTDPGPAPALSDIQRCELTAYNAAFEQIGFSWRWSETDYWHLLEFADARARIEHYVRTHHPHLLHAYDCAALASLIEDLKGDCQAGAVPDGTRLQSFDSESRPL